MNKTCRLIKNFLIIHFYLPTDSILGINNYWYDLLYYERKNKSVESPRNPFYVLRPSHCPTLQNEQHRSPRQYYIYTPFFGK